MRKASGEVRDVLLARVSAQDIAAKRRLFALLALLQESLGEASEAQQCVMDETLEVWSSVVEREAFQLPQSGMHAVYESTRFALAPAQPDFPRSPFPPGLSRSGTQPG